MSMGTVGINDPTNWTTRHTVWCMVTVGMIVLVGIAGAPTLISWLLFLLLMGVFTGIAADGITGNKHGVLIDDRNRMSLSRLQMVLWTLLILSAFLAAAINNVRGGYSKPLNIVIPEAVWMLMGISTTSLVGAPLVLAAKRSQTPPVSSPSTPPDSPAPTTAGGGPSTPLLGVTPAGSVPGGASGSPPPPVSSRRPLPRSFSSVLRAQGEDPTRMAVEGSVVVKHSPSDASWTDLFKGDEVATVATLDLSKIQMFFFTLVLVLSYAIALGAKFRSVDTARADGETVTTPVAPATAPVAPATAPVAPATAPVAPATAPVVKAATKDPKLVDEFPPLDMGFVTLLGISNAGFLVNGAIPRTQPAP
jgi:hypothetical protein